MNIIYLIMMDAYWTVFQSNSAAMRNYHWKINYNFLVIVVICLFLSDQSFWVKFLALLGHVATMRFVHERTKNARFFYEPWTKKFGYGGNNANNAHAYAGDYLDKSISRNWVYIASTASVLWCIHLGHANLFVPLSGTVSTYFYNIMFLKKHTKFAHWEGCTFHAGASATMLGRYFAARSVLPIPSFLLEKYCWNSNRVFRLLFDTACVFGYMIVVHGYAMLNGGTLFATQRHITHKWRFILSLVFFPVLSNILGDIRHHVLCFLSQTVATWIILWLSCDLFEKSHHVSSASTI